MSSVYETVPCNLCGANDAIEIGRRARWRQSMRNVVCRRCGLVYANPRLAREPLDRFYREEVYPEFLDAQGRFTDRLIESSRKQAAETAAYFIDRAGGVAGRHVLEIGCGLGHFLAHCRDAGADVLGVEMDGLYADFAERELGLPIRREHVERMDVDQRFDVVALFHVLEHLEDPKATLGSLRTRLAEGGRLFIEVPNFMGPWRITPEEFFRVEHLYNFSFETLSALLEDAGFRVEARDHDPFLLRVVATAAPERSADPARPRASQYPAVRRHMLKWRLRARLLQPYVAARRRLRPDGRRR